MSITLRLLAAASTLTGGLAVASQPPRPVLVDMDPGVDDLLALAWLCAAHRAKTIQLLAITASAGNSDDPEVTKSNAQRAAKFFGCGDVPVAGYVSGTWRPSDGFFGPDGLYGLSSALPRAQECSASSCATDVDAPALIARELRARPNEVTLLAVGPLTNLHEAERRQAGTLQLAREVMIMGGALRVPGNSEPFAEFNIWFDIEAAAGVFNSSQSTLFPLDVTTQVCDLLQPLPRQSKTASNDAYEFLLRLDSLAREKMPGLGSPCLHPHDTLPVAYLLYPGLFLFRRSLVRVDAGSQPGRTWVDDRAAVEQLDPNTWVAEKVDVDALKLAFAKDMVALTASLTTE